MELQGFSIALLIIGFLIFIRVVGKKKISIETDTVSYQKVGFLFTAAERSFYGVLNQSLQDKYVIFAKVRVADLIKPQNNLSRSEWQTAFNKISKKHIDFIICDKAYLSVVCAIELNDSSHQKPERSQRDAFLSKALSSASIPLINITAKRSYMISDIQNELYPFLVQAPPADTKICPRCNSPLVERVGKRGENQGKPFLGCSAFPRCRFVEEC